jgi:hypothetical protein
MSSTETPAPRRLRSVGASARFFQVGIETIERWNRRGYIRAYRVEGERALRYDIDEIERALKVHGPNTMRDGRKRGAGQVVPVVVAIAPEGREQ